ncbi:MAG: hypothetical protein AW07_03966 [Candidatus Accumulibacter sp. SK-11]|nr:MAG: hypothetical protein AW07_03966 [Candidatus Accumulibacter sp. SK-11]
MLSSSGVEPLFCASARMTGKSTPPRAVLLGKPGEISVSVMKTL